MKKQILSFVIGTVVLAFLFCTLQAQTVTLTFTGKDANNNWVQLNRVSITNLTKGWQETIYWPDTTLTMQNGTGIDESVANGGFALSQNNPNPFTVTTDVNLTVADAGAVTLEILDGNGKIVETWCTASLQPGTNQFRISLSAAGTYVMTARQNGKTSSIKMVCNGAGNSNRIEYIGMVQTITYVLKSTTNNPFTFGDQMEYVGYATINGTEYESARISQAQGASQTFGLEFDLYADGLPMVSTLSVSNLTASSAEVSGIVLSDGGSIVTERGFCWDTLPQPTLSNASLQCGAGIGNFIGVISGLMAETTYYVRAYAINSIGVAYGQEESFTTISPSTFICGTSTIIDIDSNIYNTVQIGNQCWMKENLRTTRFADSTTIPLNGPNSYTEPYRYAPLNNESTVENYGYLYNWAAMRYANATSSHFSFQGICPNGWHVPSDAEWSQLTSYVGSQSEFRCSVPGSITLNIAKSLASTVGWTSCTGEGDCAVGNDISANNATGFSALPVGGYYDGSSGYGAHAVFWSDTQSDGYYAYYRAFSHCSTSIDEDYDLKSRGFSVRCIKD